MISFIAIVKLYEHKLKELNPEIEHIQYDINDLYNYIDSLHDICGLMYDFFPIPLSSLSFFLLVPTLPQMFMNQKGEIGLKPRSSSNLNNKLPKKEIT
jgi:hypothetical protein